MKKNNAFIGFLLIAVTFNAYSMETPEPKKLGWIALAGATILGGVIAYRQFLSYVHAEPLQLQQTGTIDPFDFVGLPQDVQKTIIVLLGQTSSTTSLHVAAQAINGLAQTNKELHQLINEPQFCLQIIKHLAEQFNCSDLQAAKALHTQESKRRLELQLQLYTLCILTDEEWPINTAKSLAFKSLYEQGADLEFTYDDAKLGILTPLMIASIDDNYPIVSSLIKSGVDINRSNIKGTTALMFAASSHSTMAIDALLRSSNLLINKQDLEGNTALMLCCKYATHRYYQICIELLLEAGADPEIANNNGLTPLQAAQKFGIPEIIDEMQKAIDEKLVKKMEGLNL